MEDESEGGEMPYNRWIIDWRDIDPDPYRRITETAASPGEAVAAIRRVLNGITVVDEERVDDAGDYPPEAERPAADALFDGEDPETVLQELNEPLELETDQGTLTVIREVKRP